LGKKCAAYACVNTVIAIPTEVVAYAYTVYMAEPLGEMAHERPKGRWKNKFPMDTQYID
jgi:hypothetical protein